MENDLKIFKFISLESNEMLTEIVQNLYNEQGLISKELFKKLQLNSILTGNKKFIESFKQKDKNILLYYAVVFDNNIIGLFTHTYESQFNQIYLNDANIHPKQSFKGFGTCAYEIIKKDIMQNFHPSTICANAVTIAGKKFLTKVGFLPNTSLKSIESNSIYYCENQKITFVELIDVPANRCMKLAPNIGLYNTMLRDAKINKPGSILSAKKFTYLHEILLNSKNGVYGYLKKQDEIVYPVKNLNTQESKSFETEDDFSFNSLVLLHKQDVVKNNLKILRCVSYSKMPKNKLSKIKNKLETKEENFNCKTQTKNYPTITTKDVLISKEKNFNCKTTNKNNSEQQEPTKK